MNGERLSFNGTSVIAYASQSDCMEIAKRHGLLDMISLPKDEFAIHCAPLLGAECGLFVSTTRHGKSRLVAYVFADPVPESKQYGAVIAMVKELSHMLGVQPQVKHMDAAQN